LPSRCTTRGTRFSTTASTGLELADGHQHPFEEIQRFKTGDDDRHAKAFRDQLVFPETHHCADMAGPRNPAPG
jgi:hypothetical protein